MFKPRKSQSEILEYVSGKMGISAVPGSGKTHTLSSLAAQLILQGRIESDQEILIVTLVNSAVDNFSNRIGGFVRQAGLLENVGYRVRTLHGLAHDILRERPDLAGISEKFTILDEVESLRMIDILSTAYIREHSELPEYLLRENIELNSVMRGRSNFPDLVTAINQHFISLAKDLEYEPDGILELTARFQFSDILISMAVNVYSNYQKNLRFRNALDFADLIRLAMKVIDSDPAYLHRLQTRWPYILEDEAQDSSGIQERILRKLVGENGNWVRVGDPNQAIYETFTTANPDYLRNFLKEPGVISRSLPNSGRSNKSIIRLANELVTWTMNSHPVESLRIALSEPLILPTDDDDPQPNPPDHPLSIWIMETKSTPAEEIRTVVDSIRRWLPEHQDKTVAVLCPIGWYGEQVSEELVKNGIEMVELLKTSQSTRKTARVIEMALRSIADPSNSQKLSRLCQELNTENSAGSEEKSALDETLTAMKKIGKTETLLYPLDNLNWKFILGLDSLPQVIERLIDTFIDHITRWHKASVLPIDQLVITISQDLFSSPAELALSHKLALMLEFSRQLHPEYELTDFADELSDISGNTRKFNGFSNEDLKFNPDDYKGKVFVSTYHRAKGLEWDRVYLLSVNNYDFPSLQVTDTYVGEKWFLRQGFDPHAEVLEKLRNLVLEDTTALGKPGGEATQKARLDYAAERLRLLYVGITRARESLMISWNTGKTKDKKMAIPLEALLAFWKDKNATT